MAKSKALTVVINSISNFSGYAISVVLGLISYPIIIDQIGIETVGVYALIMAILAPMDLTNLGFAEATIKYVAQYAEAANFEKVRQYISTTLFMSVVVGIAGMLIIFLAGPSIAYAIFDFDSESFETIQTCFAIVAVGWLVRQITAVYLSMPIAFQKFKIVAIGNSITSILNTGSILVTLLFFKNLIGYTLGTLIGLVLSLLFWFVLVKINFSQIKHSVRFYREVWKSSLSYGGWQTFGSIGSLVTNQADKYLLGIYLPAAASGVYNVIFQIQQRILSAVWKIAEVMFPHFSASSHGDRASKFSTMVRSNYVLSVLGVLVFFPFIILAYPTLEIWISAEFAKSGKVVMQCLLLIGTFASITVVQSFFLMGNGMVKQVTLITYITGGVTIVSALIVIPIYGLNGAGYGVLIAAVSRLSIFFIIMKRFFRTDFDANEYLIATVLPVIVGILVAVPLVIYVPFQLSGLISLIGCLAAISILLGVFIILVNFLIPGGNRHNQQFLGLLQEMRRLTLKK